LVLAVSTGGASPAQARKIRQRLDEEYGPEWGPYLGLLEELRPQVIATWPAGPAREAVFGKLAAGKLRELVAAEDAAGVRAEVAHCLGEVGPGLEGLIDAAARRALSALAAARAVQKPSTREEEL
jgi:precorrin-2 dehydrogenase/sirohydrochlorin ferrochelatase